MPYQLTIYFCSHNFLSFKKGKKYSFIALILNGGICILYKRPNLKNLSRDLNLSRRSLNMVPLKIVFNVSRCKLNWNRFLADLRRSSNSLNSDKGYLQWMRLQRQNYRIYADFFSQFWFTAPGNLFLKPNIKYQLQLTNF